MGSEMCIRDRDMTLPADAELVTASAAAVIKAAMNRAIANILHRTCLLYTSDAADERSSVDLGGRRIIKKKNNYKHK